MLFSSCCCIHHLFEAQAMRTPDSVAVVFAERELTYDQLNRRANQLAHYLRTCGVEPGTRVGICVERSLEMVIAVLGVLKAGAAYVPLDPAYPAGRLAFMLADAPMPVLLTQQSVDPALWSGAELPSVVCLDRDWETVARQPATNPLRELSPDHAVYVIYTSGSTGQPKGVVMPHRALVNLIRWQVGRSTPEATARTIHFAPLSFDVSFQELFTTWCSGGTLVLVTDELRRDPVALLDFLRRQAITRMFLPFVALQRLAEAATAAPAPASLCEVVTAGEQLQISPAIAGLFTRLPHCILYNQYGPTETHAVTEYKLSGPASTWPVLPPIGTPVANCRVVLLADDLQPVPDGEVGELFLGGVCLAHGYLNRPDLTAERFLVPPSGGERLYRTGDLARRLPDGNLEFLGRADHQVKIRGFRVELGEVEAVLCRHPRIREAVAHVRMDRPGEKTLVAYVVAEPGHTLRVDDLRQFLARQLPDYMCPTGFVFLDALPLTPSGKVDRRALPRPAAVRPDLATPFVAPGTLLERTLAEIWCAVLGVDRVGLHDNFFDLGGHSLSAMQVVARVRTALQQDLPLRCLFEQSTVAGLAAYLSVTEMAPTGVSPLVPVSREQPLPLSSGQQRLWFLAHLVPDDPSYNIPVAWRFRGPLDLDALEATLRAIVCRHEVLRTTFSATTGAPFQLIQPPERFVVSRIDLSHLPPDERERELQLHGQEAALRSFDLSRDLPVHAALVMLAEQDYALLLTLHHSAADGWSLEILLHEISAIYLALRSDKELPLPPLPVQYADFAVWQRAWLQGEWLQRQQEYWRVRLAGLPLLDLPTDFPRPATLSVRAGRCPLHVPADLTAALRRLGEQAGTTLFMTVLTAFQVLLKCWSGQDDVAVGVPIANRPHPALESLIGFFVNTLVLRTDLSGLPAVRELLQRVRTGALQAYAHQDVPFDMLVEALQPDRDLSRNPLVQVAFAWQGMPPPPLALPEVQVSPLEVEAPVTRMDLELHLWEDGACLDGYMLYRADLFRATTIARMAGHMVTLLSGMVANPDQSIADLSLLTPAEMRQILVEWNATAVMYPADRCIHHLFEAQAALTPDAVAVTFGDRQVTYAALNRQANQLAHYLQRRGVGPETLVGVCLERSVDLPLAVLAVWKAGGVYVPLDPAYPVERLAFMLADAQVPVLLTQQSVDPGCWSGAEPSLSHRLCVVYLDRDWETIAQEPVTEPSGEMCPDHLSYVIYTSGSTGQPKGVLLEHRGLVNLAQVQRRAFAPAPGSRILQFSSLNFDASVWEMVMALTTGATLCMAPRDALMPGLPLLRLLREQAISIVTLPPSVLMSLPHEPLPALQILIVAGEACPADLVCHWAPGRRFVNAYGPTETTVCATMGDCRPDERHPSIGRPIDNTRLYLLDDRLHPVPVGVAGEIYIGGVSVARGYLNRPELTDRRFIPDPFSGDTQARLYRTGDVARFLPDGRIEYLGRIDQQVKLRGFRIELSEIECVLNEHPAVAESVVVMREDAPGQKRLVAYVIPADTAPVGSANGNGVHAGNGAAPPQLSVRTLREHLQRHLPEYMLPAAFVLLETLPLTPNGKLDRRALPVPTADRPEDMTTFVAPRTTLEQTIADIWCAVLRVAQVGVHDNFFELGGHSFSASQIMAKLQHVCERNIPLRLIFDAPTVAGLARALEQLLLDTTLERLVPAIDWQSETVLAADIVRAAPALPAAVPDPRALFLTGASGFVGAFLLAELLHQTRADIYCLVRAPSVQAGQQRIEQVLRNYLLWDASMQRRIIAVPGDLTRPLLGMPVEQFTQLGALVEAVYHCGALVNLLYPYPLLKTTNVDGAQEVVRFAVTGRQKPLHYVSTLGVFSGEPVRRVYEQDIPQYVERIPDGYSQTKWVAERRLGQARTRGIPVAIYRPGLISGHALTGACQTNDFFWLFLKACLSIQAVPCADLTVRLTPVDYVARAIVHLSRLRDTPGRNFHLCQPIPIRVADVWSSAQAAGYRIDDLPPDEWLARMQAAAQNGDVTAARIIPVLAITGLCLDMPEGPCDTRNTDDGLAGIGCPPIDTQALHAYIAFFKETGYFPAPESFPEYV